MDYFDNKTITAAVLQYQATGNYRILEECADSFRKLVVGIIHTHKFYAYQSIVYDDLVQEGLVAVLEAISKYNDQTKSSLFSYLSLAVKYTLIDYTKKNGRETNHLGTSEDYSCNTDYLDELVGCINKIGDIRLSFPRPLHDLMEVVFDLIDNLIDRGYSIPFGDLIVYLMHETNASRLQIENIMKHIRTKAYIK